MKKLQFTKKTISKFENLNQVKGGANNHTNVCDTLEVCTYSLISDCPATSSRTADGRTKRGSK
ncbi:hypothetical protein [uncultured Kordia sp.]|uniref:hypothetical protein n=1 Tax=uncultured Kordia sp. TaxID=507699 RepID=UPI002602BC18|nr:hypothetical protein [uncultured Kordia sp.]